MRRLLFLCLGVLELAAAIVLLILAGQAPGAAEVDDVSSRVEKVSRNAGRQVRVLRRQVATMRRRQPELLRLAKRMEKQMRTVGESVRGRDINSEGLAAVSDGLGNVADGLDGLATALDPRGVGQIGKGLAATADYLDGQVAPTAEKAASALELAGKALKTDAAQLKVLLEGSPVELKAARAMVDSLSKFEDGILRMKKVAAMKNFDAMREGFKGLESSLDSGADQVDKISNYTIPKVTVKGLRVTVEEKDFWPEGKTIAEGMRKGAKGCAAAGKEMDGLKKELPHLRASLEQSRQVVAATRQALASALASEEKLEPVLKSLPGNLSRLAHELPALTTELAKVLRQTASLKEVAAALRQAEKSVEIASERWPRVRDNLMKSAVMLRSTRKQLKHALAHRGEFERTMQQTVEVTTSFSHALPGMLVELEEGLVQQEDALDELGESIDQVSEAVPAAAQSASRFLVATRVLLCLASLMVGLHAANVLYGTRRGAVASQAR